MSKPRTSWPPFSGATRFLSTARASKQTDAKEADEMAPRELTLNVVMMGQREYDALVAKAEAAAREAPEGQQWRLVIVADGTLSVVAVKPRTGGETDWLAYVGSQDVRVGDVWFSPAALENMGEASVKVGSAEVPGAEASAAPDDTAKQSFTSIDGAARWVASVVLPPDVPVAVRTDACGKHSDEFVRLLDNCTGAGGATSFGGRDGAEQLWWREQMERCGLVLYLNEDDTHLFIEAVKNRYGKLFSLTVDVGQEKPAVTPAEPPPPSTMSNQDVCHEMWTLGWKPRGHGVWHKGTRMIACGGESEAHCNQNALADARRLAAAGRN